MRFADTLATTITICAFLGGFVGVVAPFRDVRDLLDSGQRGAFVGALVGSLGGAILGLAGA